MDEKSRLELKVGIFVFIGLIIFTYIVFSIGDFYIFKPGYRIDVIFGFVDGMQAAAPIRYAGVKVGRLEDIKFYYNENTKKTEVRLRGWVSQHAKIECDAQAYVNTLGVVGEKYLEILPGSREAGYLTDGGALIGNDPVPMEKITQRAYNIIEGLQAAFGDIKEGKGTIGRLIKDDAVYKNLEDFTADIKAHPWKLLMKGKETKGDKKDKIRNTKSEIRDKSELPKSE